MAITSLNSIEVPKVGAAKAGAYVPDTGTVRGDLNYVSVYGQSFGTVDGSADEFVELAYIPAGAFLFYTGMQVKSSINLTGDILVIPAEATDTSEAVTLGSVSAVSNLAEATAGDSDGQPYLVPARSKVVFKPTTTLASCDFTGFLPYGAGE